MRVDRHHARSPSSSSGTAPGAAATSASRPSPRSSASLGSGHILDGEQAALQDTNDHFLANMQKNGTYSVVPRIPGGEITPDKLIVIGEVARDFGLYTKITGGQRIDLFGARVEQLPEIWKRLVDAGFESGHAYGKALRTVKSCVGSTWCRYGVQDSVGTGDRARAALPRPALAAQDQVGRVRLRARVRRGAGQGRRRHRHRERLEPLRRRQRRLPAAARRAAARRRRHRDADPHDRPVPDVLHPHRRPAAAHRGLGGGARRRPRLPARGDRRRRARHLRRPGRRDGRARRQLRRRVGAACSRTRSGCARFVSFVNAPGTPDPSDRRSTPSAARSSRPRSSIAGPRWRWSGR